MRVPKWFRKLNWFSSGGWSLIIKKGTDILKILIMFTLNTSALTFSTNSSKPRNLKWKYFSKIRTFQEKLEDLLRYFSWKTNQHFVFANFSIKLFNFFQDSLRGFYRFVNSNSVLGDRMRYVIFVILS